MREEFQECRLLVIGDEGSEKQLTRYIEAGAAGLVGNGRSLQKLMSAIECVVRHSADCTAEQASLVFARLQELARERKPSLALNTSNLTCRETEILKLIDLGQSNKEIASKLH